MIGYNHSITAITLIMHKKHLQPLKKIYMSKYIGITIRRQQESEIIDL